MDKYIKTRDDIIIVDEFAEYKKCIKCIDSNTHKGYGHITCQIDSVKKRIGYYENSHGVLYCCSSDSKTTELFKNKIESIGATIKTLKALYLQIANEVAVKTTKETSTRIDRVIHNLRSINAHSIHELYALIPQEKLINNIRETSIIVEKYISADPHKAAMTFLKMAKLNLSIKAEFSIYDKLLKGNPNLDFRNHNTRDIVMIVMYMFFVDFNEKSVWIDVQDYYEKNKVDFESFQVAIYHIIENASKYIMPNSNADITFRDSPKNHIITFSMLSLYISPDEEKEIFNDGYSGDLARKTGQSGSGIGMYRSKKLIELNKGELNLEAGDVSSSIDGIDYAHNKFIITIPR